MLSKRLQLYLYGQAMTLDQRGLHDMAEELRGFLPPQLFGDTKGTYAEEKSSKILRNMAKCKSCKETVESTHVWDYVSCKCGKIAVDGGPDYLKRTGNLEDMEDLSVYE